MAGRRFHKAEVSGNASNNLEIVPKQQLDSAISGLSAIYQPLDGDLTTIAGLTAATDSFMQAKAGNWSARTITQVRTDLNQVKPWPPVNLTDGATPALNAALGTHFRLLAPAGNRTIAVPTNPTDGQVIVIEHQCTTSRTLALNTGTGGFGFGSDITALTATVANRTDFIQAVYNSTANKWWVIGYVKGFA